MTCKDELYKKRRKINATEVRRYPTNFTLPFFFLLVQNKQTNKTDSVAIERRNAVKSTTTGSDGRKRQSMLGVDDVCNYVTLNTLTTMPNYPHLLI